MTHTPYSEHRAPSLILLTLIAAVTCGPYQAHAGGFQYCANWLQGRLTDLRNGTERTGLLAQDLSSPEVRAAAIADATQHLTQSGSVSRTPDTANAEDLPPEIRQRWEQATTRIPRQVRGETRHLAALRALIESDVLDHPDLGVGEWEGFRIEAIREISGGAREVLIVLGQESYRIRREPRGEAATRGVYHSGTSPIAQTAKSLISRVRSLEMSPLMRVNSF